MRRLTATILLVGLLTVVILGEVAESQSPKGHSPASAVQVGERSAHDAGALSSITLEPIAHAFVGSGHPDTNYGGQGYVWAGYEDSSFDITWRGLVKFSLAQLPERVTITEAELRANCQCNGSGTAG